MNRTLSLLLPCLAACAGQSLADATAPASAPPAAAPAEATPPPAAAGDAPAATPTPGASTDPAPAATPPLPASGPLPEVPDAGLGYPTPADALAALRQKPGTSVIEQDGWTVVQDQEDAQHLALWSFTPPGHPAHPAMVRRTLYARGGKVWMSMEVQCGGSKRACDTLVRQYQALNDGLTNAARERVRQAAQAAATADQNAAPPPAPVATPAPPPAAPVTAPAASPPAAHAAGWQCWKAPRYHTEPLAAWALAGTAGHPGGPIAFDPDKDPYYWRVSEFNGHYGPPAAYVVTGKGHSGSLLYELRGGGYLSAYIGHGPGNGVGAFILRDRNCKFLGLIKSRRSMGLKPAAPSP